MSDSNDDDAVEFFTPLDRPSKNNHDSVVVDDYDDQEEQALEFMNQDRITKSNNATSSTNDKKSKILPLNVAPVEATMTKYDPSMEKPVDLSKPDPAERIADELERLQALLSEDELKYQIFDSNSKARGKWDTVMIFLLVETAIMVPYEIGFIQPMTQDADASLPSPSPIDLLFIINRLIDLCFLFDMWLQFHTPFMDKITNQKISHFHRIAQEYLTHWFALDLISILPFDILALTMENSTVGHLKLLRIIRLLRMFKIVRVFRASRIIRRWEAQLGMSFALVSLSKFFFGTLILAHWMACLWGLIPQFEDLGEDELSWMRHYDRLIQSEDHSQYIVALYWAVMTLTTIGYGDVLPQTTAERTVSIFCMMMGGGVYAYVVGAVCGIVASMDEAKTEFNQQLDHLNHYMVKIKAPSALRLKLRHYFYHSQDLLQHKYWSGVINNLSPGLQSQLALFQNGSLLRKIAFFCGGPEEEDIRFISALTQRMEAELFPPQEDIIHVGDGTDKMYVISRGLTARLGRVIGKGHFFGEDVILTQGIRHYSVSTLTFVDVYSISRVALDEVLATGMFPTKAKNIRKAAVFLALQRKLQTIFRELKVFQALRNNPQKDHEWLRQQLLGDAPGDEEKNESLEQALLRLRECQGKIREATNVASLDEHQSSLVAVTSLLSTATKLLSSIETKVNHRQS